MTETRNPPCASFPRGIRASAFTLLPLLVALHPRWAAAQTPPAPEASAPAGAVFQLGVVEVQAQGNAAAA